MKYAIGIDGGGTKTLCLLADAQGNVLAGVEAAGTNHQLCGAAEAGRRLWAAVDALLRRARVTPDQVGFVCMGLSGADSPADVAVLERHLPPPLAALPHQILNDVWIAFAAGTAEPAGAVSICGTGHNAAVRAPDGSTAGINALRYPLGNVGGGRMMTDAALHAAFRCHEHTGRPTRLALELPAAAGLPDMDAVCRAVYESGYTAQYGWSVPPLVDALACGGDAVCAALLAGFGAEQGTMLAGLLRHTGYVRGAVPVVLAGSIYEKTKSPVLVDSFCRAVRAACPGARFTVVRRPPCAGAVALALARLTPGASPETRARWLLSVEKTFTNEGGNADGALEEQRPGATA